MDPTLIAQALASVPAAAVLAWTMRAVFNPHTDALKRLSARVDVLTLAVLQNVEGVDAAQLADTARALGIPIDQAR